VSLARAPISSPPLFLFHDEALREPGEAVLRRLPALSGSAIRVESAVGLSDRRGPVHAGSFLRERRIVFDCEPAEFPRIFAHELFHFVWLRAGNAPRLSYETLLREEAALHARGELGWSAEWRKRALAPADLARRTRRWREYCCESFCDAAAWLYSGVSSHREFTLATRFRDRRRNWFSVTMEGRSLSI
jgi:hypothetical protein